MAQITLLQLPTGGAVAGTVDSDVPDYLLDTDNGVYSTLNRPHRNLAYRDNSIATKLDELVTAHDNAFGLNPDGTTTGRPLVSTSEAGHATPAATLEEMLAASLNADGTIKTAAVPGTHAPVTLGAGSPPLTLSGQQIGLNVGVTSNDVAIGNDVRFHTGDPTDPANADHDGRYFTEAEITSNSGTAGAQLVGVDPLAIAGSTVTTNDVEGALSEIVTAVEGKATLFDAIVPATHASISAAVAAGKRNILVENDASGTGVNFSSGDYILYGIGSSRQISNASHIVSGTARVFVHNVSFIASDWSVSGNPCKLVMRDCICSLQSASAFIDAGNQGSVIVERLLYTQPSSPASPLAIVHRSGSVNPAYEDTVLRDIQITNGSFGDCWPLRVSDNCGVDMRRVYTGPCGAVWLSDGRLNGVVEDVRGSRFQTGAVVNGANDGYWFFFETGGTLQNLNVQNFGWTQNHSLYHVDSGAGLCVLRECQFTNCWFRDGDVQASQGDLDTLGNVSFSSTEFVGYNSSFGNYDTSELFNVSFTDCSDLRLRLRVTGSGDNAGINFSNCVFNGARIEMTGSGSLRKMHFAGCLVEGDTTNSIRARATGLEIVSNNVSATVADVTFSACTFFLQSTATAHALDLIETAGGLSHISISGCALHAEASLTGPVVGTTGAVSNHFWGHIVSDLNSTPAFNVGFNAF